jgi:hypothetical protein
MICRAPAGLCGSAGAAALAVVLAACARILPVMLVLAGSAPVYLGPRRVISAWLAVARPLPPADLVAARRLAQS